LLLAIDTATRYISLALHDGHQIVYESTWRTFNNHTIELTPALRQALIQTRLAPADLTAVAVAQGPGSFTGLRIGMSVAKGLAMARQIPLVAVPTLDIVAASVPPFAGPLVAVLQAGRGRICVQRYRLNHDDWVSSGEAAVMTWEALVERVSEETLFAGEIDAAGQELLDATEHPVRIAPGAQALRRAGFLAEIAWTRLETDDADDPATVVPLYLHQPGVDL
jgi:tRNA threonylcarbamoyladenosine biosynthesis protein TsaB